MHLPKFEKVGALSHHCGVCEKLLTNTSAINTCIGTHEVICKNYHFTFHFVGKAHQCKACNHSEILQQKRHRATAEQVHEYRIVLPRSKPSNLPNATMIPDMADEQTETPTPKLKKREKKNLKRVEKALSRAAIITQANITELGRIMYPNGVSGEGNIDDELAEALAAKF